MISRRIHSFSSFVLSNGDNINPKFLMGFSQIVIICIFIWRILAISIYCINLKYVEVSFKLKKLKLSTNLFKFKLIGS